MCRCGTGTVCDTSGGVSDPIPARMMIWQCHVLPQRVRNQESQDPFHPVHFTLVYSMGPLLRPARQVAWMAMGRRPVSKPGRYHGEPLARPVGWYGEVGWRQAAIRSMGYAPKYDFLPILFYCPR